MNNAVFDSFFDSLWAQFQLPATIITPQSHLAEQLTHDYHHRQQQDGRLTWPTPDIISLSGWLTRQWLQTTNPAIPIKPSVEPLIWRHIIEQHPPPRTMDLSQLAHLACQAWTLLHQWQLPITESSFQVTLDCHYFWHWQQQFHHHCHTHHCISLVQISDALLSRLDQLTWPNHIFLVGFEEHTPQLQTLIHSLQHYSSVTDVTLTRSPAHMQTSVFTNETMELQTMLSWAHQQAHQGPVACVVPNLQTLAKKIASTNAQLSDAQTSPLLISQPLTEYPIIHTALISLRWLTETLPTSLIRRWLRSPFIHQADSDFFHYSQLDQYLVAQAITSWSLTALSTQLSTFSQSTLLQRLQQVQQLPKPATAMVSYWGQLFWQCLTLLGWPGERTPSSNEQALIEQWQVMLQTFAGLDGVLPSMSLTQALHCVNQLALIHTWPSASAQNTIQLFHQQPPIGMWFEHLWVMGMDDESWPPSPTPNPLLPQALQRHHQVPHASADQQWQFAQQSTQQWQQRCRYLHLSFAQQAGERHRQLSRLYTQWPMVDIPHQPLTQLDFNQQAADLESWQEVAVPLPQSTQSIRGGSGILTAQAQCPFRAFAIYRLQVAPYQAPVTGVSALDHGQLVHRALDYFWRQIQTHEQLTTLSPTQLGQILDQCIDRALTALEHDPTQPLFIDLEKQRLQRLLSRWLTLEQQRPDFKVIAVEQTYSLEVAGLSITVRCDRVDQLASGARLVIDYKTGVSSMNDWFGERLAQPQLPLYSLVDPSPDAISFAQVTPHELGFKGVSDQATDIEGITPLERLKTADATDWSDQQRHWHTQLIQLSQAFQQGIANIDPQSGVCRVCQLHALCRIQDACS
ncbi:MAG: hypothetical protein GKR77_03975 [Legionellales bacterium]|nr:hypothetical protein [Legionellales bacterium]